MNTKCNILICVYIKSITFLPIMPSNTEPKNIGGYWILYGSIWMFLVQTWPFNTEGS